MTEFRTISCDDNETAKNIVDLAHELLPSNIEGYSVSPETIGTMPVCHEASEAVSKAANMLGIVATTELHIGGHYFTSLKPIEKPLTPDDPIICLTWGQYAATAETASVQPYFGKRENVRSLFSKSVIGKFAYSLCYSPASWLLQTDAASETVVRAPGYQVKKAAFGLIMLASETKIGAKTLRRHLPQL